ncbi:CRISPR-associated protein Cas4 [Lagierella sp.]|uniref:CRISPR-associated protein Cas4 n=1 Tax=Lagierella sp. TaxID=2849657 RepID=UPI002608DC78|nr:CRISPR-associated protein Cas4 [Lagierella sp.]
MRKYKEEDYLMLSGIQHFCFCKRSWSLIHVEQLWEENYYTIDGMIKHEKVDNPFIKEKRKNIFYSRSVPISSSKLGLNGIIDMVEFIKDGEGVNVPGKKGLWKPYVIEYKRGKEKPDLRDISQLVAQVICLEEDLNCHIEKSFIYYFKTNTRLEVDIDEEKREFVIDTVKEMHDMFENRITPDAEFYKKCTLCSLYDLCMPRITKKRKSIENYLYGD